MHPQIDTVIDACGLFWKEGCGSYYIFIERECDYITYISHEIYHFACQIREDYSLDEEATAYCVGFVAKRILEQIS